METNNERSWVKFPMSSETFVTIASVRSLWKNGRENMHEYKVQKPVVDCFETNKWTRELQFAMSEGIDFKMLYERDLKRGWWNKWEYVQMKGWIVRSWTNNSVNAPELLHTCGNCVKPLYETSLFTTKMHEEQNKTCIAKKSKWMDIQLGQMGEAWCVNGFKTIMWHGTVFKKSSVNENQRKMLWVEQTVQWGKSLIPGEEDSWGDCYLASWNIQTNKWERDNEWRQE